MESVLVVEDEPSVRATLHAWLNEGGLDVRVQTAADAAAALQLASKEPIDLAILDWNLGAGLNGLQLLEDLHEFQPDVVAILVTGYAHKATPLDALRLGVRDYLDKSHDLNRDRFLASVRKQLERIRPLKRERQVQARLERFRTIVAQALPRLESASLLQIEGVKLDDVLVTILQHAQAMTHATAGLIILRQDEQTLAWDHQGRPQEMSIPHAHSLAAAIASLAPDCLAAPLDATKSLGSVRLSPMEQASHSPTGRGGGGALRHVLGASLFATPDSSVVIELFDKQDQGAFDPQDKMLLQSLRHVASLLLILARGERASQRMLYDTLKATLTETEQFVGTLAAARTTDAPAKRVFTRITQQAGGVDAQLVDRWTDALQHLSSHYGPAAVEHALGVLDHMKKLLADVTSNPS